VETSGLIHRSTFCNNANSKSNDAKKEPHDIARAGEKVSVRVGDVDVHRKRLQLFFLPAPQ
jgi:ribosomal protein S1